MGAGLEMKPGDIAFKVPLIFVMLYLGCLTSYSIAFSQTSHILKKKQASLNLEKQIHILET
jgi:hypothetical protein